MYDIWTMRVCLRFKIEKETMNLIYHFVIRLRRHFPREQKSGRHDSQLSTVSLE